MSTNRDLIAVENPLDTGRLDTLGTNCSIHLCFLGLLGMNYCKAVLGGTTDMYGVTRGFFDLFLTHSKSESLLLELLKYARAEPHNPSTADLEPCHRKG